MPHPVAAALRAVAAEETGAMRRLQALTSAKLLSVCLRVLQDQGAAEEVLQDVYLAVWRRPAAYDPSRGGAMSWLIAVSRNRAIDRLRSRRPPSLQPLEDEATAIADPAPDACASLLAEEDAQQLRACLAALEPSTASAIRMAFEEGATYDRIAQREGVPLGTMKSRIRRGLRQMRLSYDTGASERVR